jgi:hypothetical protein
MFAAWYVCMSELKRTKQIRADSWRRGALLVACMTLAMAAPALAQKIG